jgi:hypothetical protein
LILFVSGSVAKTLVFATLAALPTARKPSYQTATARDGGGGDKLQGRI